MNPAVIGLASAYLIGELVATPKRRHPIVRGLCVAAGGYVLIGVFSIRAAVGFLVAAKSILRFGELSNEDNRRLTEYIIIGTFMSFAYAVVVSLIVRWAIDGYLNT